MNVYYLLIKVRRMHMISIFKMMSFYYFYSPKFPTYVLTFRPKSQSWEYVKHQWPETSETQARMNFVSRKVQYLRRHVTLTDTGVLHSKSYKLCATTATAKPLILRREKSHQKTETFGLLEQLPIRIWCKDNIIWMSQCRETYLCSSD